MRQKIRKLLLLIRTGQFKQLLGAIRAHVYSEAVHVGLRRSTSDPFPPPRPRFSLALREAEPRDRALFDPRTRDHADSELVDAYNLLGTGLLTPYVAETKEGEVCYLNFVIDASQNKALAGLYGDLFPPLRADEALMEAAYTLEKFRGRGIVLNVMPLLAERAREQGIEWLVAYPPAGNSAMLRASLWAGFEPFVQRRDTYRLFRRKVRFEPVPPTGPAA